MSKIIGIDLGTTNSCVAVMEGGDPVVIPNEEGDRTTPSVVAFAKTGERLVGQIAKRQAVTNPTNTVYSIKRFMGRKFAEVTEEMKRVPYKVVEAENGDGRIRAGGKDYFAARDLGDDPRQAEGGRRGLPRREGHASGHHRSGLLQRLAAPGDQGRRADRRPRRSSASSTSRRPRRSPTASTRRRTRRIAVYDFGGGTFDISILEVGEGVVEVMSTNGDTHLGGDDIDQRVIDWIVAEFKKDQGIDLSKDKMALQRLKEAAEKAKIELSNVVETEINLRSSRRTRRGRSTCS